MLQIHFYPSYDYEPFVIAADIYQTIWHSLGERAVHVLQTQTGLGFVETKINAIVYEGISFADPLRLRASYTEQTKASTLVHELGHRLLSGNNLKVPRDEAYHQNAHRLLNLFLYDAYLELFGKTVTEQEVELESIRRPSYREAWEWALKLTAKKRAERLLSIRNDQENAISYLG
jgi:hypothetical protein